MAPSGEFMQVKKVAKRLDCSDRFIFKLVQDGHLEAIKVGKRAIRISIASLGKYIESRKVDPDSYFE
jgi:excisionase family DNA binding protein